MQKKELILNENYLIPTIISEAKIEFNESFINEIIESYEHKFKDVVIRFEDVEEYEKDKKNLKNALEKVKRLRIDTEKQIKKPLEEFIKKYKDVELRFSNLYSNIVTQLDVFKENLFNERNTLMLEIKKRLLKEQGIEELSNVIDLPEQKGTLAPASFTEIKATNKLQEIIDIKVSQYKNLKNVLELESLKNNITLIPEDYILIMENEEKIKDRISIQIKAVRENEERIKREQEESVKIENEATVTPKFEQKHIEAIGTSICIKICLNSLNKEQLQNLKKCLVENSIEYKKIKE